MVCEKYERGVEVIYRIEKVSSVCGIVDFDVCVVVDCATLGFLEIATIVAHPPLTLSYGASISHVGVYECYNLHVLFSVLWIQ